MQCVFMYFSDSLCGVRGHKSLSNPAVAHFK